MVPCCVRRAACSMRWVGLTHTEKKEEKRRREEERQGGEGGEEKKLHYLLTLTVACSGRSVTQCARTHPAGVAAYTSPSKTCVGMSKEPTEEEAHKRRSESIFERSESELAACWFDGQFIQIVRWLYIQQSLVLRTQQQSGGGCCSELSLLCDQTCRVSRCNLVQPPFPAPSVKHPSFLALFLRLLCHFFFVFSFFLFLVTFHNTHISLCHFWFAPDMGIQCAKPGVRVPDQSVQCFGSDKPHSTVACLLPCKEEVGMRAGEGGEMDDNLLHTQARAVSALLKQLVRWRRRPCASITAPFLFSDASVPPSWVGVVECIVYPDVACACTLHTCTHTHTTLARLFWRHD